MQSTHGVSAEAARDLGTSALLLCACFKAANFQKRAHECTAVLLGSLLLICCWHEELSCTLSRVQLPASASHAICGF